MKEITAEGDNDDKKRNKKLIFQKILILLLLEYSDIYSTTSGSLRNFYRDEMNDDENENYNANNMINKNKTIASKSFENKTKIIGYIRYV